MGLLLLMRDNAHNYNLIHHQVPVENYRAFSLRKSKHNTIDAMI
jgi:hypothetical protein